MDLELYLSEEAKKYESIGDFVYYNFSNKKLMAKIVEQAKIRFSSLLNSRKVQKSYVIYLALIYIQMNDYSSSFWDPVREHLKIYDSTSLSHPVVDAHLRKIIDLTHQYEIEEIKRQSIKVQFDGGIAFPHLHPLYEICCDYYFKDLDCGLTESDFLDEAEFLLEGLKHKFNTESFDEDDEITINSTVYRVIKATRLRILYTNDIMTDLLREILRLIDASFWESVKYDGSHFIKGHFQKWANTYLSDKKQQLNIKSFKHKENTEHIVRKPNLYFYLSEIFFKIPDQKLKDIDESKKIKLHVYFDGLSKEFMPSIKKLMIGYLLTGSKVTINNPFLQFGYCIQSGSEVLYDNRLDLFNYYIFNHKTGRRLNTLKDFTGRIALISKKESDIFVKNAKITSTLEKEFYKITFIDISFDSILSIEGEILSSYDSNKFGILIDKFENFKFINGEEEYIITNNKPLIIIPEDYKASRLGLKVNGKNYYDLNNMSFSESIKVYDFSNIEFSNGIYRIEVIDLHNNQIIYSDSFYYNKDLNIDLDKDLYLVDEEAIFTLRLNNKVFKRSISGKTEEIIEYEEIGIKLRVTIPYIWWHIKDYSESSTEVFLNRLPLRCILETRNIINIEIQGVDISSRKVRDNLEFDISGIHNIDVKNEISVRADTLRGNIFLFKVYLKEFIDANKSLINYDDENKTFEGVVHYIGNSPLFVVISANGNEKREQVLNNHFKIWFPITEKANIKFVKKQNDVFGIFDDEDIVLLEKEFRFFSPQNLINKVLKSEVRKLNNAKKNEGTYSLFDVKINKHIGNNVYLGKAFKTIHNIGITEFPKFNPIRVEFMSNNLETNSGNFKLYLQDGEEIFSDWEWKIE